eukprot:Hpha_TRINITY_DN11917_c1_g1::TRINITY_DN11917_c1_g1_i1::g.20592::m.20592
MSEDQGREKSGHVLVPVTVLLVIAALFSSFVSVGGGMLLYFESLSAIEDTVREVAASETFLASSQLRRYFEEAERARDFANDLFFSWRELATYEDLQRYAKELQFSYTKSTPFIQGMQVVVTNTSDPDQNMYQGVWWDPLTDKTAIANNFGSRRQYVSAYILPYQSNDCKGSDPVTRSCVIAHSVNPASGEYIHNVYNFSRRRFDAADSHEWSWYPLQAWKSSDGTPYWYAPLKLVTEEYIPGHPLFGGGTEMTIWSIFFEWRSDLLAINPTGEIYVLDMLNGMQGIVLVHSKRDLISCGDRENTFNDLNDPDECTLELRDLDEGTRERISSVNDSAAGSFHEAGGWWVQRAVVFEGGPGDRLAGRLDLVWMRSKSSVRDRVLRSLVYFVVFICIVLVFDLSILTLEVLQISVPLRKITAALIHLETMSTDKVLEGLEGGGGAVQVSEVHTLRDRLRYAVERLVEFRRYLPVSLLASAADYEDEPEGEGDEFPASILSREITWMVVPGECPLSCSVSQNSPQATGRMMSSMRSLRSGRQVSPTDDENALPPLHPVASHHQHPSSTPLQHEVASPATSPKSLNRNTSVLGGTPLAGSGKFHLTLKMRRVCYAVVTPSGVVPVESMCTLLNALVSCLEASVAPSKGLLQVAGGSVVATWNTAFFSAQPTVKALTALTKVQGRTNKNKEDR